MYMYVGTSFILTCDFKLIVFTGFEKRLAGTQTWCLLAQVRKYVVIDHTQQTGDTVYHISYNLSAKGGREGGREDKREKHGH